MKTTVVIDDNLLREAMKATGIRTKRAVIEMGLRELIRKNKLEAFKEELGTFDLELSLQKLNSLRNES